MHLHFFVFISLISSGLACLFSWQSAREGKCLCFFLCHINSFWIWKLQCDHFLSTWERSVGTSQTKNEWLPMRKYVNQSSINNFLVKALTSLLRQMPPKYLTCVSGLCMCVCSEHADQWDRVGEHRESEWSGQQAAVLWTSVVSLSQLDIRIFHFRGSMRCNIYLSGAFEQ